ncbi:hypothetical protein BH11BAC3_BH11BAC3_18070 [soil metagenome]
MTYLNKLLYAPGGEQESGTGSPKNEDDKQDKSKETPGHEDHKTLGEKVKEALQDWSNKDQQDLDFDDTRV